MPDELHILILEDRPTDAELAVRELRREGLACVAQCVTTEADFRAALEQHDLDLILADYALPSYDGLSALTLAQQKRPEVPFIFVSGRMGEDVAIDALHHGATDYVLKQRLARLGPAVRRAQREAEERARRQRAETALSAREIQLAAAAQIQQHLLPHSAPNVPGLDIVGRCYPAEFAAGDLFDFLTLPDGTLVVVVADVTGHGVGPALLSASFQAGLETLAELMSDLPRMASLVNARLFRETAGERFITMLAGLIDPRSRTLRGLNAGHPPLYVLDALGQIKARITSTQTPIGLLPDAKFTVSQSVQLVSGDLVLLYTDGLVEAHRPKGPMLGIERALDIVRQYQAQSALAVIEALYEAARQHVAADNLQDDISLIVVRVL
jgi:sigma-B regulation protein RsbU (phosphoserine phosphatase)